MKKSMWKYRSVCAQSVQSFWLGRCEMKDVMEMYGISPEDRCHGSVTKLLIKTKKDFVHGFSFFTRESTDLKIVGLMRKFGCKAMEEEND